MIGGRKVLCLALGAASDLTLRFDLHIGDSEVICMQLHHTSGTFTKFQSMEI